MVCFASSQARVVFYLLVFTYSILIVSGDFIYFLFVMFFQYIVFLCAKKKELNKDTFDICSFSFINPLIVTFRLIERLVRFGLRLSVDYKHRVLKIDNNFLERLGLKTVLFR